MSYSSRTLSDPRDLRAVAHPVRLGIMEQLIVRGAMTATELGERLDQSPANCSWHLRKLAEHGFVEEASGAVGRKRPWRAVDQGMSWSGDAGQSPEQVMAGEALSQILIEREVARFAESRARLLGDTRQWQDASTSSQSMVYLTARELDDLNQSIRALLMDKVDRFDRPELRPDGARLCAFMAWGAPAYGLQDESLPADVSPVPQGRRDA